MSENTTDAVDDSNDTTSNPAAVGYQHTTDLKGHQMNLPMHTMRTTDMTTMRATSAEVPVRLAAIEASHQLAARQAKWNLRIRGGEPQAGDVRDNLIRHQGITILTQLSGSQYVTASVTNIGRTDAMLTVVIGTVVLTIASKTVALRYGKIWTDHAVWALQMPAWAPANIRTNRYAEPGVIVTATDNDVIRAEPGQTLKIISGRVVWDVLDRRAFADVHLMWRAVIERAKEIWPT